MNQFSPDAPESAGQPFGTLIHVGQPKTATTFLQLFLFNQHSQVTYLGKIEGRETTFCSGEIANVARCLRQPTHPGYRQEHDECREILARIREPEKLMIFSDEAYTYGPLHIKQKQAELFGQFFGNSRILLTVREPLSLMESLYLQELRGYHYHKMSYKRLIKQFGAPPRYFSVEDWLEANWNFPNRGAFSHLLVADTAEAYADIFGKENVMIRLYEELKQDNLAFVRRLSEEIGIDAVESERLCENQNASKNARWKEAHVERLKLFNRSPLLRWKYRYLKTPNDLKRFLGVLGPDQIVDSPNARAEFPPEWRERILQIGSEQFTRLKANWEIPFERYRYHVTDQSERTDSGGNREAA